MMKKLLSYLLIGLVLLSLLPAYGNTLKKAPNHVYIATFNVIKLGAVDQMYKGIIVSDFLNLKAYFKIP